MRLPMLPHRERAGLCLRITLAPGSLWLIAAGTALVERPWPLLTSVAPSVYLSLARISLRRGEGLGLPEGHSWESLFHVVVS